jgi:hypothetical protein
MGRSLFGPGPSTPSTHWMERRRTQRRAITSLQSEINKIRASLFPTIHPHSPPCWPGVNPTIASYNASVVNFYNATGSLARFENKNILFYFVKHCRLLQRWRCSCKLKNRRIGSRDIAVSCSCPEQSVFIPDIQLHAIIRLGVSPPSFDTTYCPVWKRYDFWNIIAAKKWRKKLAILTQNTVLYVEKLIGSFFKAMAWSNSRKIPSRGRNLRFYP